MDAAGRLLAAAQSKDFTGRAPPNICQPLTYLTLTFVQ